jgi:branched-chain amino acid transport system permease protein
VGIFDIFLLEALINGILLGGVLALLSASTSFGVIDVVDLLWS